MTLTSIVVTAIMVDVDKKDLDQIGEILDQRLKPIVATLDKHTGLLEEHSTKLDSLQSDVFDLQEKVSVLGDIHEMVKENNERLNRVEARVEVLEAAA